MKDINKKRVYWACRRGLLEIEFIIFPFLIQEFDHLNNEDKKAFLNFLEYSDVDILSWLIGYSIPRDKNIRRIVHKINNVKYCFDNINM